MKNLFRENRVVWEEAPRNNAANPDGAMTLIPNEGKEARESREKSSKTARDLLLGNVELKKDILYKRLADSFAGQELSLDSAKLSSKDPALFRNWFKREVWSRAVSMDAKLWKDVELGMDANVDVWSEDARQNPILFFSEGGKRNEVLADMFATEVFAQLNATVASGVPFDALFFKLEYQDGKGVKVVRRLIDRDSSEYATATEASDKSVGVASAVAKPGTETAKPDTETARPATEAKKPDTEATENKDELNYDEMANQFLNSGGIGKFVVSALISFGVIPNKAKEGQDLAAVQREAVKSALKGEDPILGWFCDLWGCEGGCKGTASGLKGFLAGTGFAASYDKFEDMVTKQKDKMKSVVQAVNKAGGAAKAPEVAPKVLAQTADGKAITVAEGGAKFNEIETVDLNKILKLKVPKGSYVTFGTAMNLKERAANGEETSLVAQAGIKQEAINQERTFLVDSGIGITKDTLFSKGVVYQYLNKEDISKATA